RAATVQDEIAASGDITFLTERLNEAKRWKELRQEQIRLTQQRESIERQLAEVQQRVIARQQQETTGEQKLQDLRQQYDRAREEENEKVHLGLEAQHLGKDLQEAAREEKRMTEATKKMQADVAAAEQTVQKQRLLFTQAEQQEQADFRAFEDSRQQHEAEHLRATLSVGAPCPVCQVPVHEVPPSSHTAQADLFALQQAHEAAKATVTQATQVLQKAETSTAALRAQQGRIMLDLAERTQKRQTARQYFVDRFPGFSSLSAALEGIQAQRQEIAARLKTVETEAQTGEKEKQATTRQREKAQQEEATLNEALRRTTQQLETGTVQLQTIAAALASYLSTDEDPEIALNIRRSALVQREQEVRVLEQAWRKEDQGLGALRTKKLQTEGQLGVLRTE
ncbi:MAG: hypothetical protein ACRD2L_21325, partial [Terriglobia bacterium]